MSNQSESNSNDTEKAKLAELLFAPSAKVIGRNLETCLLLMFKPIEKRRHEYESEIKQFATDVERKIDDIPKDDIQDPPAYIIGPALEASRFYMSTKEMREMFANLVAHACDQKQNEFIHPSFVSILTQLSPLDACIIREFRPRHSVMADVKLGVAVGNGEPVFTDQDDGRGSYTYPELDIPIAQFVLHSAEGTNVHVLGDVLKTDLSATLDQIAGSVANLRRLGLIETRYDTHRKDVSAYDWFYQTDLYQRMTSAVKGPSISLHSFRGHLFVTGQFDKVLLIKGLARLTAFGNAFFASCVVENLIEY